VAIGELSPPDKQRVNEAVALAEETTGLEFCVIVGVHNGDDPRREAERRFHKLGMHQRPGVMIMVMPEARRLEVVTAPEIGGRLTDEACDRAVVEMTPLFADGHLAEGLERGVELLAAAAGHRTDGATGHADGVDLPNIVDLDDPDPS
jgi:uncharacterized membrane protein YgcG